MDAAHAPFKKNVFLLVISLLTLLTYPALYFSRFLDDNSLTSWQWAFQKADAAGVFLILVAGVILSFFLSRITLPAGSPAVFLFLTSFAAAALFWREPEVIVDSSRYFTQAKHLEFYGIGYFIREWGRDISAWTDMPLIPFLYGLVFKFLGEARVYVQILTTLFYSMSVVLTYFIGKALWDEDIGFFAGALLLGMPYLFTQAPLMLVDVPVMFFFLLSVFTFIRALDKGGLNIPLSALALFLVFFSKYSTWPMLSILPVILSVKIVSCRLQKQKIPDSGLQTPSYLYRGLLVAAIAALFAGGVFLLKFDVFSTQMNILMTYQRAGLKRWGESFISTFFFQINPFITAAALYSFFVALRKKDLKYAIVAWPALLVIIMHIKRIRYIIMLFPMLTLMASYGLSRIRDKQVVGYISLCVVSFSLVIAVFVYLPFLRGISAINLKHAGEFLDSMKESYVEVFTTAPSEAVCNASVSVPILDLYTGKDILYKYQSSDFSQPAEKIEKSPLRFTWEYRNPAYYGHNKYSAGDTAVAVISDETTVTLPEDLGKRLTGYRLRREFKTFDGVFRFSTGVRIYSVH